MLELSISEYFVVCVSCWKHGPSEKTIEKAVQTARLNGWVYVPDLAMNRCPECAAQPRVEPTIDSAVVSPVKKNYRKVSKPA